MFYRIEPEVAGGWGDRTVVDRSTHPPVVSVLEYRLDGWLGDEILETFPCYIVTESLMEDFGRERLVGYEDADVMLTVSDAFSSEYAIGEIPKFRWLKIDGNAQASDFMHSADHRLIVSEKAMTVLKAHRIAHADIEAVQRIGEAGC